MDKTFLKECLNDLQRQREYTTEKIKRYESGDRSPLLVIIYERGDFHKTLAMINKKISKINKLLTTA